MYLNKRNIKGIRNKKIKYDGLITICEDITLTLASADCYPVALTDKKGSFASLLHAGREGIKLKIVAKMIDMIFRRLKISPQNIVLLIGPGIKPCCYDIDIVKLIKRQARSRGLLYENIVAVDTTCTCCGKNGDDGEHIYFSHHRSTKEVNEEEGRFITVVSLNK